MDRKYWVPAIERADAVLRLVAERPGELRLIDLSRLTDIHKSSMFSLLATLEQLDWLRRDQADTFRLGPALGSLSGQYFKGNSLIGSFHREAAAAAAKLQETIQLAELTGKDVLYLAKEEYPGPVRLMSEPGMRYPAHATALGKVMLAGLPAERVARLFESETLQRLTPNTIASRRALLAALDETRERGYAVDAEEAVQGFCCVAVPVVRQDRAAAAVSCSMPRHHWETKRQAVLDELQKLADRLSVR